MIRLFGHIDEHYKETFKPSGAEYDLVFLWNKLVDYGNYWHLNTPTANGNPDFMQLKGWIDGYCAAKGWDWVEWPATAKHEACIVVTKNDKPIIYMTINEKPKSYYESIKEINECINKLI